MYEVLSAAVKEVAPTTIRQGGIAAAQCRPVVKNVLCLLLFDLSTQPNQHMLAETCRFVVAHIRDVYPFCFFDIGQQANMLV